MPFKEDFADLLGQSGIKLSASDLPSQDDVQAGLIGLKKWLDGLEKPTREAADGVTAEFQVKAGLADPEVNIAPGLAAVLRAADKAPMTLDITHVLTLSEKAFAQAAERDPQV